MNMQFEEGKIVNGKVTGITKFGAFVELEGGVTGLVHISEVSLNYVEDINEHLKVGDIVEVKVLPSEKKGKIGLSIKQAMKEKLGISNNGGRKRDKKGNRGYRPTSNPPDFHTQPVEFTFGNRDDSDMSFEDKLNRFKQASDEKMHDIKRSLESKRGVGRRGGNNY